MTLQQGLTEHLPKLLERALRVGQKLPWRYEQPRYQLEEPPLNQIFHREHCAYVNLGQFGPEYPVKTSLRLDPLLDHLKQPPLERCSLQT